MFKFLAALLFVLFLAVGCRESSAEAPDLAKFVLVGQQLGECPNGEPLVLSIYAFEEVPGTGPTRYAVVFLRPGGPVAILFKPDDSVYVYSLDKTLPLDDVIARWPNPCDLPLVADKSTQA